MLAASVVSFSFLCISNSHATIKCTHFQQFNNVVTHLTTQARCHFHNIVIIMVTMNTLETLAAISADLTAIVSAEDRYIRLLDTLKRAIPFNAAALLRVAGNVLIPIAARGLAPDATAREYPRSMHPRLDIICSNTEPVIFSKDSPLPDPFDGLLLMEPDVTHHIHACMGCPLRVGEQLVGVLVADALDPGAFDHLPPEFLKAVGSMAAAQMHTVDLMSALEERARRQGQIATDLMRDVQSRQGNKIIGESAPMAQLRREIMLVAKSDFTTLILGETGVGKELVARAIHQQSTRSAVAMLYLNCAALPEHLAESELFGHVKGAFTGATADRTGKFELADGGTLFLDEIGELSLEIQAKILRAIQEGEVQRIGSEKMVHVDVRLIAATNRNLEKEVKHGRFRADLYHRLNVYPLRVPPLRERKDDIALLTGFFCERMQLRMGLGNVRNSREALTMLQAYNWPGNVRELENIISRAVLKASAGEKNENTIILLPHHLPADLLDSGEKNVSPTSPQTAIINARPMQLREAVKQFQIECIKQALLRNDNNWAATARDLGMHRSNLHNLATRLGIR
jgi:anaerobic nitric oxide reductase transcription regulator